MKIDMENVIHQLKASREAKIDVEITPGLEARITLTEPPMYQARIEVKRIKINEEEAEQKCRNNINPEVCKMLYIVLMSLANTTFKHTMKITLKHDKQTVKIETLPGLIHEDKNYIATDTIKIELKKPIKELNPERYEKLVHQLITITPLIEELYRKIAKIAEITT